MHAGDYSRQSASMTARTSKVSLNRSPLAASLEDVQIARLPRELQRRLGCAVNEEVFLECPYAFVPRQELLSLARQVDSPLQPLLERIAAYDAVDVLLGYASDRIAADESGDFAVYLTEESRNAAIQRNRAISRELWRLVREEISKSARGWRELGAADVLEESFVRPRRPLREIQLLLPMAVLRRRRRLGDRAPGAARDGYVELTPLHEVVENVRRVAVAQPTQTHLPSEHAEAQTYPGHPKNQWTQYEYEIDQAFVELWHGKAEDDEEENGAENENENGSEVKEKQDISEEELKLRESRREAWERLSRFLESHAPDVLDAVSFNASTNLYTNDVVNLARSDEEAAFTQPYRDYEERLSLIDLKTVGKMHLMSASWHYVLVDVIACAYLNRESKDSSLVALWSLQSPLRPKFLLDCEDRLAMLSFCALPEYTNVLVGGCLDGKIIVWEVDRQLFDNNAEETVDSYIYESKEPEAKECQIAVSAEKSQRGSITSLQWLPAWCRIESDGNYHRSSSDSPRDRRAQFATTSTDGSVFFWSLPRALSRPAQARSPLHLTISPVYQLRLAGDSVALTGLCLPLAASEESSTPSIRDQADLERLRRIFLGTSHGEVLCCGWEGQTFSVDVTDRETCTVAARYCAHDGLVRAMVRSPHLDDVFLTVGGRRFTLWKEDFAEAPIFQRASADCCGYADACWSIGRPGTFILARMNGYIELWDLKRRADEPVLLQTVSGKMLIPSPPSYRSPLLAVLDAKSTVRVLVEPQGSNDEGLERLEWCEEFAWRESKRKLDFRRWQDEYMRKHPTALRRKAEREQAEANRRHREARERFLREQEAQAREEAARRLARRRVSKSVLWRRGELRRAEAILLAKKGFVPEELEEKRRPLVQLEEQRRTNRQKTRELLDRGDELLERRVARELPEIRRREPPTELAPSEPEAKAATDGGEEREADYRQIREELLERMRREPYRPKIRWRSTVSAVRRKVLGIICMSCSSPTHGTGGWFVFVSVTAFIMTLIWCILYMFSIREVLKLPINWILTELINTAIYTILYFTAFVTQLAWARVTAHIVAGVFGIFNTIAYGAGTYFLYLEHKNSQQ